MSHFQKILGILIKVDQLICCEFLSFRFRMDAVAIKKVINLQDYNYYKQLLKKNFEIFFSKPLKTCYSSIFGVNLN